MMRARSDAFVIVVVTVGWLVTIPFGIYVYTRIVGWPLDLALLCFLPFVLIWFPISYPLSISHNRSYRLGKDIGLSPDALVQSGLLGMLTGAMTLAAILLYGFFRAKTYWAVLVVGFGAVVCAWAVVRVCRGLLKAVAPPPV
jgi:hypothetical protein